VSDIDRRIDRWVGAGVIDTAAAERIRTFERNEQPARPVTETDDERPGLIEALLYLGFAVAGAGVVFLVGQQWGELEAWSRLMVAAVSAGLALAAGAGMHLAPQPGVRRAGHVAWLVALVLVTFAVGVAVAEYGPGVEDERGAMLGIALVAFVLALVLWAVAPSHPQVLGVAGAAIFLGESLGAWPDDFNPRLAGSAIALVGIALIVATEAGIFRPLHVSRLAGAMLLGGGAFHAGIDSSVTWEALAFVAGAGLIAAGVARHSFTYVAAGVATLLVALITFMFEHFEDRIGAPVALMISGGLLVAAVLILIQVRGLVRRRRAIA
jgi:hypothetical protein